MCGCSSGNTSSKIQPGILSKASLKEFARAWPAISVMVDACDARIDPETARTFLHFKPIADRFTSQQKDQRPAPRGTGLRMLSQL